MHNATATVRNLSGKFLPMIRPCGYLSSPLMRKARSPARRWMCFSPSGFLVNFRWDGADLGPLPQSACTPCFRSSAQDSVGHTISKVYLLIVHCRGVDIECLAMDARTCT